MNLNAYSSLRHDNEHAVPCLIKPPASHDSCMVCGAVDSLGLRFLSSGRNAVAATFQAHPQWQGYSGVLHGGMISTLLDAAMTHCLFRQGIEAMTASLKVRFIESIPCTVPLEIRAKLEDRRRHVYFLTAEITSSGRPYAKAEARFIRHRNGAGENPATSTRAPDDSRGQPTQTSAPTGTARIPVEP